MTVGDAKDLEALVDEGTYPCLLLGASTVTLVFLVQMTFTFRPNISNMATGQWSLSPRHYLCADTRGRLGNQMFQYASVFGVSRRTNMSMRIKRSDLVAKYFHVSAADVFDFDDSCKQAGLRIESKCCSFDPKMLRFKTNKNWKLSSYLQSWKYFEHVEEELKMEFRFKKTIAVFAERVFEEAVKGTKYYGKGGAFVGIHIRRGDMATFAVNVNGTKVLMYNVAPMHYILNAMRYFVSHFHKVAFVICSDEMSWVKNNFTRYKYLLNLVFIHNRKSIVDLAILSKANHTIVTSGTFGWWAAWLAGGTTVYYKHFVPESSPLRSQFSSDFSDYYPPGWIGME
ncbi:galactoside 2-alpha-L-fucosyltransferase Sec1-like [Mya arenaria]|uniref:galactoside 2-alpha-L-fucosyltransferase Sec1-like n=1 Tax=Mya arenaria TaxID=6604 RepID=UPI0022E8FC12|nr:galactoside 2-alpha-L-fucosyltransferase Sec1-like [Mya arenaria]